MRLIKGGRGRLILDDGLVDPRLDVGDLPIWKVAG
jgi:hypothetical protein